MALALEGISWQRYAAARRAVQGLPVDCTAGEPEAAGGLEQAGGVVACFGGAAHRRDDPLRAAGAEVQPRERGQRMARSDLDELQCRVGREGAQPGLELHRAAQVLGPVGR